MPFEDELSSFKKRYAHGSYEYIEPFQCFRQITTLHFRYLNKKDKHSVYVVRRKSTKDVLYIGKGGTVTNEGRYKSQDIPGRLKATREGDLHADFWFSELAKEMGGLIVEYVFLPTSQSPALVEAILLQVYLNEYGHLPYKNKTL